MSEETPTADLDQQVPSRAQAHVMFDRISARYDFLNHFLSAGQDFRWRKKTVAKLKDQPDQTVLDLACGTGDLMLAAVKHNPNVSGTIGVDPAQKMLRIGIEKITRLNLTGRCHMALGDGLEIPLQSNSMDGAMIAFGIRNMPDVDRCLVELHRILRPGGRLVILEFSLPHRRIVRIPYLFYLRHVLPVVGGFLSGDRAAYRYLNVTIETFWYGAAFLKKMTEAGFREIELQQLNLGIASIYVGDK